MAIVAKRLYDLVYNFKWLDVLIFVSPCLDVDIGSQNSESIFVSSNGVVLVALEFKIIRIRA